MRLYRDKYLTQISGGRKGVPSATYLSILG